MLAKNADHLLIPNSCENLNVTAASWFYLDSHFITYIYLCSIHVVHCFRLVFPKVTTAGVCLPCIIPTQYHVSFI